MTLKFSMKRLDLFQLYEKYIYVRSMHFHRDFSLLHCIAHTIHRYIIVIYIPRWSSSIMYSHFIILNSDHTPELIFFFFWLFSIFYGRSLVCAHKKKYICILYTYISTKDLCMHISTYIYISIYVHNMYVLVCQIKIIY